MADGIAVLHVEDDPGFADVVSRFLEEHDGITVETAGDADEGEAMLPDVDPECVVSDYDMPGRNGLEFLESVREYDEDLPFLLFTGKGSEEVASQAIEAGASGYLQKRGGADQYDRLANRIRTLVGEYRANQELRRTKAAIDDLRDGIAILDESGDFVYVNRTYAECYGYEPDDLLGGTWDHLYPESEIERFREEVAPTLEEAGNWEGEFVAVRRDGRKFRSTHSLSMHDDGSHTCVIYRGTVSEL